VPRIAFLGDTLLGGDAEETLRERGYGYALEGVRPVLEGADLVVANQEGPITRHDQPAEKPGDKNWWYRAQPESLSALMDAGVRVVSLANNHILDYGRRGLEETLAALDAVGIGYCGAGHTEEDARRPALTEVSGVRLGFLSAMARYKKHVARDAYATVRKAGPLMLREAQVAEDLARLEDQADLRIVLVHWGRNYRPVTSSQRRWAALLRQAGADLVIGHHPHIAQPVDLTSRSPVLFSIGNAAFGSRGRFAEKGQAPYGLIPTIELDRAAGVSAIDLRLAHVDNRVVRYRSRLLRDRRARAFLFSLVDPDEGWYPIPDGIRWERV
jgi:poly-gamma-glutamate capsule biosynthesis protein CapA/YwtB (metallophosphatase superfamily)